MIILDTEGVINLGPLSPTELLTIIENGIIFIIISIPLWIHGD